VVEQLPVAALTVAGERTAVAADGVVLGPALLSSSLPALSGTDISAVFAGQRVRGASLLAALSVLGAAPAPLARAVTRVYTGPEGLTVAMHSGLLVYFGDGTLPHAKWLSLARVLSDPSSAGAAYVDVRLPERPAAGFAGGAVPETGTASVEPGSASDPTTAAELAAGLTADVGGGSSTPSATGPAEASSGAAPKEAAAGAPAEAASAAPAGTTSTTPTETTSGTAAAGASTPPTAGG
jgi:hypothetical protein